MADLTYVSFGAGVQSTALLLMANLGLRGCPRVDVAIFADTQDEPRYVYEHLERIRGLSRVRIDTVTRGRLSEGAYGRRAVIPAFTLGEDGGRGMLRKSCTQDFKIRPINRHLLALLGRRKGQRKGPRATALIGISLDEAHRMRPSRCAYVDNAYPLVDARMRRGDCERLLVEHGWPVPHKSACKFCPLHDNGYWRALRDNHPADFAEAVAYDERIRNESRAGAARPIFLHSSLVPLREADLRDPHAGQGRLFGDGFGNECEGVCGV